MPGRTNGSWDQNYVIRKKEVKAEIQPKGQVLQRGQVGFRKPSISWLLLWDAK